MPTTAAFVSQKGGVGKSTLARLLAIGAIHRGCKTLLADFDLDQLTCVEWGALRMRSARRGQLEDRQTFPWLCPRIGWPPTPYRRGTPIGALCRNSSRNSMSGTDRMPFQQY
jgi:hypothetical protein